MLVVVVAVVVVAEGRWVGVGDGPVMRGWGGGGSCLVKGGWGGGAGGGKEGELMGQLTSRSAACTPHAVDYTPRVYLSARCNNSLTDAGAILTGCCL